MTRPHEVRCGAPDVLAHRRLSITARQRAPRRPRSPARGRRRDRPRRAAGRAPAQLSRCSASAERLGIAGRHGQRALPVREQFPCRGRVGRDEWDPPGERLERLVRDHAASLVRRPEDPEAQLAPGAAHGGAARSPPSRPIRRSVVVRPRRLSSWPLPITRKRSSGAKRAAPRIVSRPWAGSASRRRPPSPAPQAPSRA